MSRGRKVLVALGILLSLAILSGSAVFQIRWTRTPGSAASDTLIQVPAGLSSRQIAELLGEAGVLSSPRLFHWGVRLQGEGRNLKAGRYLLGRPSAPALVLAKLRHGETERLWLTLPEGLWLDEAVGLIAGSLELDSLDLARRVRRPRDWPYRYLRGRADLEGFLFPDTYAFEYPSTAEGVLSHILASFDKTLRELERSAPAGWSLSTLEWVTLASIVEAEARLPEERSRIAAVYLNRLRRGMRLEADPTVMYALGRRRPRLFYKHLEVDSPYNTYRQSGLPPGPICNPGLGSLRSLLEADPADPSLYFVASGTGGHLFSETYEEHRRKVEQLRRERGSP